MTEQTNEAVQNLSLRQLKIADLKEDIAALQAKLAALEAEEANAGILDALTTNDTVTVSYGRGDKKRELTGTITATANDEKLGKMLAVAVGEGIDVQIIKVRAADVILPTSQD